MSLTDLIINPQVVFERRTLLACTILVGLSICVWAVSIGTDYWLTARTPVDRQIVVGEVGMHNGTKIFSGGNVGLFRCCTYGYVQDLLNVSERKPYREYYIDHFLFFFKKKREICIRADIQ